MNHRWLLALIISIGALARFYGLDFGLLLGRAEYVSIPFARPDEEEVYGIAFRFLSGDFLPQSFVYPTLYMYALAVLDVVYLAVKSLFFFGGSLELLKERLAMNPSDLILLNRVFAATLGTLTIPLVYRIGKSLFDRTTGVLSALFLSLLYLHVRDSHFGVLDVPVTFMMSLALVMIVKVYRKGRWKDYLWAGISCGLALSTKWPGIFLLAPLVCAHGLSTQNRFQLNRLWDQKFLVSLLLVPLFFVIGTPYSVLAFSGLAENFALQKSVQAYTSEHWGGILLTESIGWWYHLRFSLWHGMGWPLFLSFLCGIALSFKRNARGTLLLLSLAIPFYFMVGRSYLVYVRWIIPLLPLTTIFAAVTVERVHALMLGRRKGWLAVLCVALLLPSVYRTYWFDRVLQRTDSRILAGEWTAKHVPRDHSLLLISEHYGNPSNLVWYVDSRYGWPPDFLGVKPPSELLRPFRRLTPSQVRNHANVLRGAARVFDVQIVDQSPLKAYSLGLPVVEELKREFELLHYVEGVGNHPKLVFDHQDAFYVPFVGAQYVTRPGPNIYIFGKAKNRV
jgi:hypothetical protein